MMTITKKALRRLEKVDPARAALAHRMATYLNHLCGCVERGDLSNAVLRTEEGFLLARLEGLVPPLTRHDSDNPECPCTECMALNEEE